MTLNKRKGRMFKKTKWTWNPLAGCTHGCKYCYAESLMKRWGKTFEPQIREHFFKDKMPNDGSWIFVGSMGDTFCAGMPDEWIEMLLDFIEKDESNNVFLLQTKNPQRFADFMPRLVDLTNKIILGTTLETTGQDIPWSVAPPTGQRAYVMRNAKEFGFNTFLSLEPLAEFDLDIMTKWIGLIKPEAVEIGVENYTSHTISPSEDKIVELAQWLVDNDVEFVFKDNLKHLYDRLNMEEDEDE